MQLEVRGEEDEQVLSSLREHPHFLPPVSIRPKLVLDLGCWIGYTTRTFALLWSRAEVIGVEADFSNASLAVKNCSDLQCVRIVNAVVGTPGQRVLGGAAFNHRSLFGGMGLEVNVVSVDQVLADLGETRRIDFCKMDVEGAELECLTGEWVKTCKRILVDTHPGTTDDVLTRLRDLKFEIHPSSGEKYGSPEGTWFAYRR